MTWRSVVAPCSVAVTCGMICTVAGRSPSLVPVLPSAGVSCSVTCPLMLGPSAAAWFDVCGAGGAGAGAGFAACRGLVGFLTFGALTTISGTARRVAPGGGVVAAGGEAFEGGVVSVG